MYRTTIVVLGLLLTATASARGGHSSTASHSTSHASPTTAVHGYTKKDGTYVAGYTRTTENHTKLDNWSTKGNVNPYTGTEGTKDPYAK